MWRWTGNLPVWSRNHDQRKLKAGLNNYYLDVSFMIIVLFTNISSIFMYTFYFLLLFFNKRKWIRRLIASFMSDIPFIWVIIENSFWIPSAPITETWAYILKRLMGVWIVSTSLTDVSSSCWRTVVRHTYWWTWVHPIDEAYSSCCWAIVRQ